MLGSSYTLLMALEGVDRSAEVKAEMCWRMPATEGRMYITLCDSLSVGPSSRRVTVLVLRPLSWSDTLHSLVREQRQPLKMAVPETVILAVQPL